jgi:hypothetical protein
VLNKRTDKWRMAFNRQGVRNAGIPVFYSPDIRCSHEWQTHMSLDAIACVPAHKWRCPKGGPPRPLR